MTRLTVFASSALNQDQLWRLFDLVPGLDFCDLRKDRKNNNGQVPTELFTSYSGTSYLHFRYRYTSYSGAISNICSFSAAWGIIRGFPWNLCRKFIPWNKLLWSRFIQNECSGWSDNQVLVLKWCFFYFEWTLFVSLHCSFFHGIKPAWIPISQRWFSLVERGPHVPIAVNVLSANDENRGMT